MAAPSRATNTLTPRTAPTWRKLVATADPSASRAWGSVATAAPDWTGMVSPMPRPMSRVTGSQRAAQSGVPPMSRARPTAQAARAGGHHGPVSDAGGQPAGRAGHRDHDQRRGRGAESGPQDRIVPGSLQ